jgi:methylated-DNA-[protein]-cysteine S-methyltransferase
MTTTHATGTPSTGTRATGVDTFVVDSPVGDLELSLRGDTVVGLRFTDLETPTRAERAPGSPERARRGPVAALERYFAGDLDALAGIDVELHGTEFQLGVWSALRDIPVGQVASYAEIAAAVGRPTAFRAVGQANHVNPVAVIVPCHRVIASNGTLAGYGGGLDRKHWLLTHEGFLTQGSLVPGA